MVGRSMFKTRICVLYRKGRCHRQTCSFAHGDAELRRYNNNPSSSFNVRSYLHCGFLSGLLYPSYALGLLWYCFSFLCYSVNLSQLLSFTKVNQVTTVLHSAHNAFMGLFMTANFLCHQVVEIHNCISSCAAHYQLLKTSFYRPTRRDNHAADLRDKIGRQWSPPRRNSLERDARDPLPSPRYGKRSDWGHRKRQHFDGENDYSGSLRLADGVERKVRDRKPLSPEFDDIHDEQLKQAQSEIDMLEDNKQQLQVYLEESAQEAESLSSKIEELEMQLSTEKEECKRISSKIRKFVKANNRHTRIQEELKRSQARLQRLGDQLGSDARAAANDDDINNSILSDEETMGNLLMSPRINKGSPRKNETTGNHLMVPRKDQYNASPSKKRMRSHMVEADERSKQGSAAGERASFGNMRSERHSRWDPHLAEAKNTGELRTENNGTSSTRPLGSDGKRKPIRRNSNFSSSASGNRYKDLKSIRMAANAVDEVVEVDELNEKLEAQETSTRVEGGSTTHNSTVLPPPPPPPIAPNAYFQYKGENETLEAVNDDGDDVDEDEMLDVDIV